MELQGSNLPRLTFADREKQQRSKGLSRETVAGMKLEVLPSCSKAVHQIMTTLIDLMPSKF